MNQGFETLFFYGSAAAILLFAGGVVFSKNPLRAALSLIGALCSLAWMYVLLDAGFVAAMQILVYAGAIMVLFIFVIMLLNLGGAGRPFYLSMSKILGTGAVGYLLGRTLMATGGNEGFALPPVDGTVKAVGTLLLTQHLFAFEAISVLLLVAVVGAVVLGLRRLT